MAVPGVSIRVVDLITVIRPHIFMAPAGSYPSQGVMGISTIVIAGHLEPIFADGPRHDNVVDLPSGIVVEHVVCAPRRDDSFKCPCHADWIVIVNCCG